MLFSGGDSAAPLGVDFAAACWRFSFFVRCGGGGSRTISLTSLHVSWFYSGRRAPHLAKKESGNNLLVAAPAKERKERPRAAFVLLRTRAGLLWECFRIFNHRCQRARRSLVSSKDRMQNSITSLGTLSFFERQAPPGKIGALT